MFRRTPCTKLPPRRTPCTKLPPPLYFEGVGKNYVWDKILLMFFIKIKFDQISKVFGKARLFIKVRYFALQCTKNVVFISIDTQNNLVAQICSEASWVMIGYQTYTKHTDKQRLLLYLQGYPQRMRLQRRLQWIYVIFTLYSWFPATVNLFLSLPNHYINHFMLYFRQ